MPGTKQVIGSRRQRQHWSTASSHSGLRICDLIGPAMLDKAGKVRGDGQPVSLEISVAPGQHLPSSPKTPAFLRNCQPCLAQRSNSQ